MGIAARRRLNLLTQRISFLTHACSIAYDVTPKMSTTWSSSDTRHQPDDLSEITKKLEKVKTEQDQRDDSERAEADAAMDWDGRQYRIDPREAQVEKIKDVSMAEKDVEPIFIEFEEGDPANPFNWPNCTSVVSCEAIISWLMSTKAKKWRITFMSDSRLPMRELD